MKTQQQIQQITAVLGESRVLETMTKLAQIEEAKCLRRIERVKTELRRYEQQFSMSSDEAWKKYQTGELGDDFDVMEWMALFENLKAFQGYYTRIINLHGTRMI